MSEGKKDHSSAKRRRPVVRLSIILGTLTSVVLLVGGFYFWGLTSLGDIESVTEVQAEVKSPDGKYVATWYISRGPAFSADLTCVNLRPASEEFKVGNVVLLLENMHSAHPVQLAWKGPRHLVIRYSAPDNDVRAGDIKWEDVTIAHENEAAKPLPQKSEAQTKEVKKP